MDSVRAPPVAAVTASVTSVIVRGIEPDRPACHTTKPEYAEAIQMYDDDWEKMLKCELPESIDLLKELKSMGYGIYGLTNWSAEKIGYAFANYSFFSLFDGIVVSGVEKVVKPDRKIYEILLERYSLKPGECVFIDDNQDNVDMAKVLGINAIRFDNIGNVKEHLETLLNKQL